MHTLRQAVLASVVLLFSGAPSLLRAQEHPLPTAVQTTPATLIPAAKRKPVPEFTLTDSSGKMFSPRTLKGQVVLINFWATWCGGCKYELPWFADFAREHTAQGLHVIGVSMDDNMPVAKNYFVAHAMPYPTVLGNDALASKFGLTEMPMSILVDRHGRMAIVHSGVVDRGSFDSQIQTVLAEK